jgi:hypothetical protein
MKRTLMTLAVLTMLAMPMMAMADDQPMPPEANWTPTPPAQQMVDVGQLASLLVEKGMISRQEYAQLTRPQSSTPTQQGPSREWSWNEIDNSPVLRAGRSGGD